MSRWLWLGSFFFLSIPALVFYEQKEFNLKEPYYQSPVRTGSDLLPIRHDFFGKGTFGASRNGGRLHAGIDLTLPLNSRVLASKSGRVFFSGDDAGYGHFIELRHPDGLSTRYAHLSAIQINEGDWVFQGQAIGLSGRSGNAIHPGITPHLHFEIRYHNQPLNPGAGLLDPKLRLQA